MEPTRLTDGDGDGFERELLEAARRDRPPAGALLRGAAVLGLAASSASITATTAGTASAAGAKASGAALGSASLAKWLGIGAAVGIVTTSGARIVSDPEILTVLTRRDAAAQSAPLTTGSRPVPAAPMVAAPPRETDEVTPPDSVEPAAPMTQTQSKTRVLPTLPVEPAESPASKAAASPSLAAEVSALERARRSLLAHRPNDVFRALDEYAAARQTSVLAAEAELLRIEALLQSGQRSRAVELARKTLARAPNGPHAARLREIVE
jgi:hypothetical protein